jgi:hypothetical protein
VFGVGNDAGNVIAGNFGAGIRVTGDAAIGNIIQGDIMSKTTPASMRPGKLPTTGNWSPDRAGATLAN